MEPRIFEPDCGEGSYFLEYHLDEGRVVLDAVKLRDFSDINVISLLTEKDKAEQELVAEQHFAWDLEDQKMEAAVEAAEEY